MNLAQKLRNAGISVTKTRCIVLQTLLSLNRPLSHAEILAEIQSYEGQEDFDRVTLYRILDAFVNADLVHSIQGIDGIWRFCAHAEDVTSCPGGHPHFLCSRCGGMHCLLEQELPHIAVPKGFEVQSKQMVLLGLCAECCAEM